ncbi:MAG: hypothetical protein B7C55_03745 [Actinomycetales bacterium mxb001]|nr:MAG: hypothetical protein B7C55_03745 [Actinomycetales bacterium mxb001]
MEDSPAPESPVAEAAAPESEAPRPSWIGIWAFVLALLGLGPLLVLGSVLGMVLGRVAIRRSAIGPVRGGRGLATAAFVIGLATLALITLSAATYALVLAFGPA